MVNEYTQYILYYIYYIRKKIKKKKKKKINDRDTDDLQLDISLNLLFLKESFIILLLVHNFILFIMRLIRNIENIYQLLIFHR